MSRYVPPELNGHRILFKGKRYWVFEVDKDHPFDIYDGEYDSMLIYDKLYQGVAACGSQLPDGNYSAWMPYGQGSIDFDSESLQDLVRQIDHCSKWIERELK